MTIGIIGLGNLGTAIAQHIAKQGSPVLCWEFNCEVINEVNSCHYNSRYLPKIKLSENIKASDNINDVFTQCDTIFIAIPCRFIRATLEKTIAKGKVQACPAIVNLAKGYEPGTGKTAREVIQEFYSSSPFALISGPSLANELTLGVPTAVTVATTEEALYNRLKTLLSKDNLAIQFSDDMIGTELGGIFKNVYALGLGIILNEASSELNLTGAFITKAAQEIQALSIALGAKPESIMQLSGMGDLIATALSPNSHNVTMGKLIKQGLPLNAIEAEMGVLPEGYHTLEPMLQLAKENHVNMPLAELISEAIQAQPPLHSLSELLTRIFR